MEAGNGAETGDPGERLVRVHEVIVHTHQSPQLLAYIDKSMQLINTSK